MPTTLDCTILRDLYGTDRMREVFDSRRVLQGWLDSWAALAEVQVPVGIVPDWAAKKIRAVADAGRYDLDALRLGIASGRHVLYPAVKAMAQAAGDAGGYVHWGSTTEDIIDTGMVLQLRDGIALIEATVAEMLDVLRALALAHKDTPMAARTHFQHAVPITFGLKVAVWIDQLARDQERLRIAKAQALVGHLGGAVGTLAAMGPAGDRLEEEFCRVLGLGAPSAPWYAARDRWGELVSCLGMLAATIERICLEVARLQSNDIGELAEPLTTTQVGSSTMPQKHNPVNSSRAAATCKLVRGLVPVMMGCMVVSHERDLTTVTAEWLLVPQCMIMIDGALTLALRVVNGLGVDAARMRRNLDITQGGIVSEAVLFALAPKVGRLTAHDLTMAAAREAARTDRPLLDVLLANPAVTAHLTEAELRSLVDPTNYLGLAPKIAERLAGPAAEMEAV